MGLHWERGREQQTLLKRYNRLIFPLFSSLSHSPFLFLHFQLQSTHCQAFHVNTVLSLTHTHTHTGRWMTFPFLAAAVLELSPASLADDVMVQRHC